MNYRFSPGSIISSTLGVLSLLAWALFHFDVVAITDLTSFDHIERELALLKVDIGAGSRSVLEAVLDGTTAHILDDQNGHYTVELIGGSQEIDRFMAKLDGVGKLTTVVRSGAMAVARGAPVFGRR